MITQQDIRATDYLTWEYCHDPDIQYLECAPPSPMKNFLPNWFKDLKGDIRSYMPEGFADDHTIRHCLGFRGILNLGYTIALPETLDGYDTYFSRGRLHPEMIHGTKWANKGTEPWCDDDFSLYEYRFKLLHWPWRAKMSPGWRLIILPYLLDWPDGWNEFAGAVEPNYVITQDGTGIGHGLKWTQPVDLGYNYYNLETVMAFRRSIIVPKGTVTFCALPYYDPSLLAKGETQ